MDHRLLEIIACPVCNGKLWYNQEKQEIICKLDFIRKLCFVSMASTLWQFLTV